MTQRGRMEFAEAGGRINTDFIDNSAGVDTSDHEVNIKILLSQVMRAGELDIKSRNTLLGGMTGEVAGLVLRSNYLQTQAISMMEELSGPRLDIQETVDRLAPGLQTLKRSMQKTMSAEEILTLKRQLQSYVGGAFPVSLQTVTRAPAGILIYGGLA